MGNAGQAGTGIVQFLAGAELSQVLRWVLEAAEAVRRVHETGQVHGGLSAETIVSDASTIRLLSPPPSRGITPYTAPEILQGSDPDRRSDIFAFGCILREVFAGRGSFVRSAEGNSSAVPAASGKPWIDPLVSRCLANNPAERYQHMRQVITELKLLIVVERQQSWPAHARHRLETEIRSLVSRVEALERRLEAPAAEVERSAPDRDEPAVVPARRVYWFPGRSGRGWPPIPERSQRPARAMHANASRS